MIDRTRRACFRDATELRLDRVLNRNTRFFKRWQRLRDLAIRIERRWGRDDARSQAALWRIRRMEARESFHDLVQGEVLDSCFDQHDCAKLGPQGLRELERKLRLEPSAGLRSARQLVGFHPPKGRRG